MDINGNTVFQGKVQASDFIGGTINIGNGNFRVDNAGKLVANNANRTGFIKATGGEFAGEIKGQLVTDSTRVTGKNGFTSSIGIRTNSNNDFIELIPLNTNTLQILSANGAVLSNIDIGNLIWRAGYKGVKNSSNEFNTRQELEQKLNEHLIAYHV